MNSGSYFLLITNDSRVAHQGLDVFLIVLRDFWKGELRESFLKIRPLILDHTPVEASCENRLGQSFKVFSVIFRRFHTPRRHGTNTVGFADIYGPRFHRSSQVYLIRLEQPTW